MREIRANGEESNVDKTISILLHAGMSTPCLREAAARGVDVESAGRYRVSFTVSGLGIWQMSVLEFLCVWKHESGEDTFEDN